MPALGRTVCAQAEETGRITFQREVVGSGSFVFSSEWRGRKRRRGFLLLTLDACLTGRCYYKPRRQGDKLKFGRGPTFPSCSMFCYRCRREGRFGGRVGRSGRSGLRFCFCSLASSRKGVDGTKSLGKTSTVGSSGGFQRVAFPLSPATPRAATTAQRWESRERSASAARP